MTVTAAQLRKLHSIHRQLSNLNERLARGPRQVRLGEQNLAVHDEKLAVAAEELKRMRMASDQKELQLKTCEMHLEELRQKLNGCSSNREYQTLREQIAADEMANSVTSDEILEAFDKIDEAIKRVDACEEEQKKASDAVELVRQRVEGERAALEADIARLKVELTEAESELDEEFKGEYQRIAIVKGEDALAMVEGESCGSCYQKLTPQMLDQLLCSKPVFCKSCGCLLYLPENTEVGE